MGDLLTIQGRGGNATRPARTATANASHQCEGGRLANARSPGAANPTGADPPGHRTELGQVAAVLCGPRRGNTNSNNQRRLFCENQPLRRTCAAPSAAGYPYVPPESKNVGSQSSKSRITKFQLFLGHEKARSLVSLHLVARGVRSPKNTTY